MSCSLAACKLLEVKSEEVVIFEPIAWPRLSQLCNDSFGFII